MSAKKMARGFSEEPAQFRKQSDASRVAGTTRATLGEGGRLVIPVEMRKAMDIKPGDTLILKIIDGELRAVSQLVSIRKVQERLAPYRKPGESAVDEFLADRREEQERSDERFERLHAEGMSTKKP